MKTQLTNKPVRTLGWIYLTVVLMPAVAFGWNQATHAYIADRLGARVGYESLYEMWGSVAPDLSNFIFDPELCPGWISDQTQGADPDSVMKAWNAATTDKEEALAFGFVSHNDSWGADCTAHHSGLTFGGNEGYIIAKAKLLLITPVNRANPQRTFGDVFAGLGLSADEALLVAHGITEDAIDIRLANEVEPLLGRKLAAAAREVTRRFPPLLVKAFAADYAEHCFGGDCSTAASVLTAAEEEHRKNMIFLGQAISQSKPVAVQLLAEQLVEVLPGFLGRSLPIAEEQLVEIFKAAMFCAMSLCDDYKAEIEATIEFVGKNLKDHGITCGPKKGEGKN